MCSYLGLCEDDVRLGSGPTDWWVTHGRNQLVCACADPRRNGRVDTTRHRVLRVSRLRKSRFNSCRRVYVSRYVLGAQPSRLRVGRSCTRAPRRLISDRTRR